MNKIKEFDKNFSNIFFLISLLFIIIFLVYARLNNNNTEKTCVMPKDITQNYKTYAYNIKYEYGDDKIDLYIKKHRNKFLIEKHYNDIKDMFYIDYTDVFIKSDEKYIKYNMDIIKNIDNKYLIIEYINELSEESTLIKKNERDCFVNPKENLTICINLDNSIELSKDDYKLTYTIDTSSDISDFSVNTDKNTVYTEIVENKEE